MSEALTPARYRKRPVEVEAARWRGGPVAPLYRWLGWNFGRADAHEVPWEHEDEEQLVVWNSAEKLWLPVPVGHWIIRGVQGEFYPCAPDIFEQTYEVVSAPATSRHRIVTRDE